MKWTPFSFAKNCVRVCDVEGGYTKYFTGKKVEAKEKNLRSPEIHNYFLLFSSNETY